MEDNTKVINALKRLERAGGEHSKATEKLHEAAKTLAWEIKKHVPSEVKLPRGYSVVDRTDGLATDSYLVKDYRTENEEYVDSDRMNDYYQRGDFNCKIPGTTRHGLMQFSHDIATGWLDELAAFMEERAKKGEEATATLTVATEKLQQ